MTPFKANSIEITNSSLTVSPTSKLSQWGFVDINNNDKDLANVSQYGSYIWDKFINYNLNSYFYGDNSNKFLKDEYKITMKILNSKFEELNMMTKIQKLYINGLGPIQFTYLFNGIQFILNKNNLNNKSLNWINFSFKDYYDNAVFSELNNWTIKCIVSEED